MSRESQSVSRQELLERLRAILVREFELEGEQISDRSRLIEDLDLDSIDGVTIAVRLEALWDVSLSDREVEEMATVGDIVDALAARLGTSRCP